MHVTARWGAVVAAMVLTTAAPAFTQVRVPVSWDRNRDIFTAGYRVLLGTRPGAPETTIDTGAAVSTVLTLPVGATYFMSVRAYAVNGTLGPPSAESVIDLAAGPAEPGNMHALTFGSTAVLSWSAPSGGGAPVDYLLTVGSGPGAGNLLRDLPIGNVQAISGNVPPGVYYASVRARNLVGMGPRSSEVRFEIRQPSVPMSPLDLSLEWAGTVAHLSWSRPPDAWGDELPQYYVLEAGTAPGQSNVGSFSVGNTTSYAVDVPPGTYYVRVRGIGSGGTSAPSNELVVQGRGAPGQARDLTVTTSGGVVHLSWNPPAGDASSAASYVVEAGSAAGLSNLAVVNVGATTRFSAAVPAGVYYIRVRAANARGVGAPSNEVVARP